MRSPVALRLLTSAALLLSMSPVATAAPDVTLQDVLIRFKELPGRNEELLVKGLGNMKHRFHLVPAIAARIPTSAITVLERSPLIEAVEPDLEVWALDAELDNTWGVKRIGAGTVAEAGNLGEEIKVAIIDSGIDCTHPELAPNCAGGIDFVNDDALPTDDNGHGTHVAGTVAALRNAQGVVGVGPNIKLYAVKVLSASGGGNWSDVIAALQWAVDNGMQVTNNSYGSSSNPGTTVELAFANAEAAGIVNVAAAGNAGKCVPTGNTVGYPARYSSVIAVAATDVNDARACFSSTGEQVAIAAPGAGINSTKMGGGYVVFNGTSMASPHVAGVAALVLKAGVTDGNGNGRVNDEVRAALTSTAKDLGVAGRDQLFGFGLVDAVAAVAAVAPVVLPPPPDPAITITLGTNKSSYVSGTDTSSLLTVTVLNELDAAVSGLSASAFVTTVDSQAVSLSFAATQTAGTYTASLPLSSLSLAGHTVVVTVTDTRNVSDDATASFTIVAPPTIATGVGVTSVTYALSGRDLLITHTAKNNLGANVPNATIVTRLRLGTTRTWNASGTTGSNGTVVFRLRRAPSGCYTTEITGVNSTGLTWDGVTPSNSFCK
ncbi:MAG: S8 family peptidase [Candidatus Peregrinibacteria bacterium]|nr:S8 family peptidase [Candidatus Peregrinibacteria bacterium]